MEWVLLALAIVALAVWAQYQSSKKAKEAARRKADDEALRRNRLADKWSNSPFKDDILNGTIRVGMTVDHLRDAWGPPLAIDERVLKNKVVHTYKYDQVSARTFRQKIKVENGIVVGWSRN